MHGDEHAAVDAVAVVHDAAGAPGMSFGALRQAGRHQPDEVGFDLEVDVVGVGVVLRRAGERGRNAAA